MSFAMTVVASMMASFLDFIELLVIFSLVPALAGWSIAEVSFLYGITSLAFAFCDLFVGQLDSLSRMVRSGTFDAILVRPLGSLGQVVSSDIALRRVGKLVQGTAILTYAIASLDIPWTAGRALMLPVMIASASVIFASIWIAGATIAFWVVDSVEIVNSITYGGNYLTQHPLGVFGPWLRRMMAFVIPLAFVNYFPALYVIDKVDPLGYPEALRFLSPVVAVACALVARVAWRFAIRRYRSTGS